MPTITKITTQTKMTPNPTDKTTDGMLPAPACSPSLDCPHDVLVSYIRSMKGGERVMEMGGGCLVGATGTVELKNDDVCIRWDHREYADGAGVMVTSFTGGARIILENDQGLAHADNNQNNDTNQNDT